MKSGFFGKWKLKPELANYEFGEPPRSDEYTITPEENAISFHVNGELADGRKLAFSYRGVPDGQDHETEQEHKQTADTITTYHNDEELVTVAKKSGKVVNHAKRELVTDGQLMKVTQSGQKPDGSPFSNVSYYEKV